MQTTLQSEIDIILKQFPEYWENEELLKHKVIEDLRNYKEVLINALISNELVRETYSIQVRNTRIFKLEDFIGMLRYKNYWSNSYTKYSNEIGLTSEGKYLKYNTDVVLDFPYKDTVLKGGMSKEDVGKEEIFYHNVLAKEEIDILLSPKVLTNVKKFDTLGEHNASKLNESDNLIIKGNNLIALHTLKTRYVGKIKLIYIDPPYNTKSAANTFSYNNSFNHSSWLTFMKNRIEVAKDLLASDGIFIVSIDDNELFYLGTILDEIFGMDNRLGVLSIVHNPGGRQDEEFFPTAHENMIVYALDKRKVKLNNLPISDEKRAEYVHQDEYGRYKIRGFRRSGNNSLRTQRPQLYYSIYIDPNKNKMSLEKFPNSIEILPIDSNGDERCWRWGKQTFLEKKEKYLEIREVKNGYDLYVKEREEDNAGEKPKTIWNKSEYTGQNATNTLKKIFNNKVFTYPKSEFLMRDIIQVCTNKHDLILDFFMGSATTPAVALKMERQFIGVEQMDYINTVSVPRLQKVIEGDQSGISKTVNWKEGGDFLYAELHKLNQLYVDEILQSSSKDELNTLISEIEEEAFLDFKVEFNKVSTKNPLFTSLSLEEQKNTLIKVLDGNQLYLSYSEIEDERYNIPESIKEFNHSFYKGRDGQ
ncbi:site-specific DNA-methyltransferase [Enterococcus dispar]|uniref:site-specific DNA-methyltransferase n=1 Tax=Enterococcus dispar TaxID=44009 RepID=UPI00288DA53A|nr:site-specific DNA-methyltransferase [Enterococcus dispar]MDT2706898.1 site-specific DNA-methyltransferase [Enterococcus dispar]